MTARRDSTRQPATEADSDGYPVGTQLGLWLWVVATALAVIDFGLWLSMRAVGS